MNFAALWESWRRDTVTGRWDEWSPYVVSLRAWNLCGVFEALVRGSSLDDGVLLHLRSCLGFLHRNLELDVRGNHLLKNLKAIIGLGVFFGADVTDAYAMLTKELSTQVLDDGGHFELSPSYHIQVMADLLDLADLLEQSTNLETVEIRATLERMARWLSVMSYPDGSLPLIGDCTPPPPELLAYLRSRVPGPAAEPVEVLESSGFVVVRPSADTMMVVDVGHPCPPELPAHAQADWGTFEVWADGRRVVVDPGVSTYVGTRRSWERSTPAHNTVSIDGQDSTEVWGSFRAGRLGTSDFEVTVGPDCSVDLVGHQYGYRHLPGSPVHTRRVSVRGTKVRVSDEISAQSPVSAVSNITMATGLDTVWLTASERPATTIVQVAAGFGHLVPAMRLTLPLDERTEVWWQFDLSAVPSGTNEPWS